jgi:septum site-determining protein MinC
MATNLVQGAIFTLMVIRVGDPRDSAFEHELAAQIARSPRFFEQAPVVLDLKDNIGFLDAEDFDVAKAMLRRHRLVPVGVQNASPAQQRAAAAAELAVFAGASRRGVDLAANRPPEAPPPEAAAEPVAPPPRPEPPRAEPPRPESPRPEPPRSTSRGGAAKTMLVTQPVRSGAQIYARGADLVITNTVSPGAEIIADGHIHVYGALRGRAIAGANGDTEARIFAAKLEAELVSIAGRYLVSESIAPEFNGQAAQIALVDDRLTIQKY